jgi:RNA polymerase sigma-70 factor (ECF subfamily)
MTELVNQLQAPQGDEPQARAQRRQLIGRVRECLDRLPDLQAEALELKYVEGYRSKEIAERFGISDEAAQSLLARARRAFREVCDSDIVNEAATENGAHEGA